MNAELKERGRVLLRLLEIYGIIALWRLWHLGTLLLAYAWIAVQEISVFIFRLLTNRVGLPWWLWGTIMGIGLFIIACYIAAYTL